MQAREAADFLGLHKGDDENLYSLRTRFYKFIYITDYLHL